ncbi:hypothetical protein PAPYR_12111 [Paratrimastix pyriformis]|uniref:Uncharacterized protein n=1 Tax=Paratrimastix pyriformis TaxID=342808 RepID=A0ABQ8U520_9EUKA|nr:hypothetical protein PAPYR_12111 [Paratrimastix pyriformis]
MEICSENDDLDGHVSNFVMMHAEIQRNDPDFKVLTQKMLPELAKLFGYITVHKQRVVSRALLKTIVEMLGSLEREMLVSSMTDFFYQVLGSVTWHAGQSDLEVSHRNRPPHLAALLLRKSLSGSKKGRAANPLRSPLCTPAVPAPSGTRLHINRRRPPPRPPRFLTQWSPSRLRAPAPQPQPRRRG